jgi:PAS domain S-box-containing protein
MKITDRLNRRMQFAFGSAILTLLAVGVISYRSGIVSSESDQWVHHTHDVLGKLQDLLFASEKITSSCRGYVLTGEEAYLESYRASKASAEQSESNIRSLTADNPRQQQTLLDFDQRAAERIKQVEMLIRLRRSSGMAAAAQAMQGEAGQLGMDDFPIISKMRDEELRLLAIRDADAERRTRQTKATLLIGTVLGLLVSIIAGWSAQHGNSGRGLAEMALRDSEEKYRTLLDGIHDYAIFMLDPVGRIISWNAGAERIKGYAADEIIGHNFSCFYPPEDIKMGRPEEVLRMAAVNGRYEEQGMRVRKDGTRILASVSITALHDVDGSLRGYSNVSRDLRESEQSAARYRGLLEAAPDAMVVVNQSGEIVLLNVQAEKQFGYRRDELVGQQVKNIIPEGFAERLIADGTRTTAEALEQQIGTGIELVGLRKDGSEFPLEMMLSPLESAEGILVTAAIRDISVRRAAEAKYRALLEAAPDAMVVVNQFGEIVLLNIQAEKQFGYRRDELVGQQVRNIIPEGFAERLIADALRSSADALAQQIGTGIELVGLRRNGSEFPIEMMLSPLESAEGILVTAAIRDISVRRTAEAKYRALLEASPDAMVVVNQSGEIVLLNVQAEKQFGYFRDELVGQKVENIIPEGFAERLIADALRSSADALAQQIGTGIELVGLRKNGSEFPIEIMLSPLEGVDGILVTAAIRDITVRKDAELELVQNVADLKRSNEELEQFAYVASHDLQEPLRMVASYTQLLSRRYKGRLDTDADEFIAFAVDGANRMQRLIQDLLAYSRVGTKGKDLSDTSSEEALQQALANLRGTIAESGALVTHDLLPLVKADESQLVQLFQNLIGNGIKYQKTGVPKIHISASRNGGRKWIFSVQDNGLGIDPQYFERIFGMFQRLHKREEFEGTGIGLAICKKIVERHGGSISVESQPGHGSTFQFALIGNERKR